SMEVMTHLPVSGRHRAIALQPPANGGSGGGIGGRWIDEPPPRVGGIGLEVVAVLISVQN
ncbi:hypothetical protein, partial [Thiolapillus sp.]|uniref:hypothetical protein n=1 Tax=Thiolapillus sp. TaxID=2017437 RepID=UPI003AF98F0D